MSSCGTSAKGIPRRWRGRRLLSPDRTLLRCARRMPTSFASSRPSSCSSSTLRSRATWSPSSSPKRGCKCRLASRVGGRCSGVWGVGSRSRRCCTSTSTLTRRGLATSQLTAGPTTGRCTSALTMACCISPRTTSRWRGSCANSRSANSAASRPWRCCRLASWWWPETMPRCGGSTRMPSLTSPARWKCRPRPPSSQRRQGPTPRAPTKC
mmetsp:Transcript_16080/g.47568  ORF Transcript_16080/g.47568 Transcript_16080/m.47568 type:complete len:210 (-) Transcript_16080:2743-3372(-)